MQHDRKLIRMDGDSQTRKGYYSSVSEIQSPSLKRQVIVDKQYIVPGQKVVTTESIVSPGQKRVLLNDGHFISGNSQVITTEKIVSPGISPGRRRIVHGHKEVVSPGRRSVVYQDDELVEVVSPGTKQIRYVNHPSVVYVDGDRLDNRHSYVVSTDLDHQHSPGKTRRSQKVIYDNVLPRVNTNLINDPNEVIREMQVDHGYKHDAELVFQPGENVTKTSGVYATSKPLSHGHVGLNKVNPIHEKIRNSEQIADQNIQFAWKNRNNRFTGEKDQPQLIVHEEVSPTRVSGRSHKETYTIADVHDHHNTMAAYVLKTGSPDRFNRLHHREYSPAKKSSESWLNGFSKRIKQFENFKQGLGADISEKEAIRMFEDHLATVSRERK